MVGNNDHKYPCQSRTSVSIHVAASIDVLVKHSNGMRLVIQSMSAQLFSEFLDQGGQVNGSVHRLARHSLKPIETDVV